MCYICKNVASLPFKNGIMCYRSAVRRLSGPAGLPACGPAANVTCELPQLPRRIHRPWLPRDPQQASSQAVRRKFLDHFAAASSQLPHTLVPSSSVVARPGEGAFFINAGMNQFKARILGEPGAQFADVSRAANAQRCIRVGGKHNDLEAVGRDGSHHTFFEMLGSWSFGDYWKREACQMAWRFLTEVMQLPASQLYVTYFGGCPELGLPADSETRDIWLSLGVSDQRLMPFGLAQNFWEMGDSGPCGPCTEIHFDHVGGRCARCFVNSGLPDVVELWNLVFMSHVRPPHGAPLVPLGLRTVDTGMGLERLTALVQGATSAYDTDLFEPLFRSLALDSGAPAYTGAVAPGQPGYQLDASLRIVADHARALTVAIGDGLTPGARGAEHKLRQLATRACLHAAHRLRLRPGALARLAPLVAQSLAPGHADLAERAARLAPDLLLAEEAGVLARLPLARLTPAALTEAAKSPERLADFLAANEGCSLDVVAFFAELHSVAMATATLEAARDLLVRRRRWRGRPPLTTTKTAASAEAGPEVDDEGEEAASAAPSAAKARADLAAGLRCLAERLPVTDTAARHLFNRLPDGSYEYPPVTAKVVGLAVQDSDASAPRLADSVEMTADSAGEASKLFVVLDRTNFYCEAGGQMSDVATLVLSGQPPVDVTDALEVAGRVFHRVSPPRLQPPARWTARVGGAPALPATVSVDAERRLGLARHHTAAHALTAALDRVCGGGDNNFRLRGSCVRPDELTLSLSAADAAAAFSDREVAAVEAECRRLVAADTAIAASWMSLTEATAARPDIRRPAADFDYPARVRVVRLAQEVEGAPPAELCCGSHLARTGDLQDVLILSVASTGRGQRELRALAGPAAVESRRAGERILAEAEAAASADAAADIRRRLAASAAGAAPPVGRLHRAGVERALAALAAMTPQARGSEHAASAEQLVARLLEEAAAGDGRGRVRRLAATALEPGTSSGGVGLKRAILRSISSEAARVFQHCDFVLLSMADRTLVITNESHIATLESHLQTLSSSDDNPGAHELKRRDRLVIFEADSNSPVLASLTAALEAL